MSEGEVPPPSSEGGVEEPLDGGPDDDAGCDEDHLTLDRGGEVLGLRVPEVVVLVLGAGGDAQREERGDRGDEVDDRLGGVGGVASWS